MTAGSSCQPDDSRRAGRWGGHRRRLAAQIVSSSVDAEGPVAGVTAARATWIRVARVAILMAAWSGGRLAVFLGLAPVPPIGAWPTSVLCLRPSPRRM